jgi:hypothetical protein
MVSDPRDNTPVRKWATAAAVIGLVVVALIMARGTTSNGNSQSETDTSDEDPFTPEQCIQRWLEAAQAGDAETYLSCFSGKMRDRLGSGFKSRSAEDSRARLKSGTADLKSYVTTDTKHISDTEATLLLERIYGDRNDREHVRLKHFGDEWKIVEMTPVDRFAPEIPYGTLVAPEADEDKGKSKTTDADR